MSAQRWSFAKKIRHAANGIAVAADVNAEVAMSTGSSGTRQHTGQRSHVTVVSSSQDSPITQHRGQTVEDSSPRPDPPDPHD